MFKISDLAERWLIFRFGEWDEKVRFFLRFGIFGSYTLDRKYRHKKAGKTKRLPAYGKTKGIYLTLLLIRLHCQRKEAYHEAKQRKDVREEFD